MDEARITALAAAHPDSPLFRIPETKPREVVCEIGKTELSSTAIALIDRSEPHYHRTIKETYFVQEGELTVHVDGTPHALKPGDLLPIGPGQVHWAEGNGTKVLVGATPPWTPEDHFVIPDAEWSIMEAIHRWQNAPYVHPLTCGNDSRHQNLVPRMDDGNVILACPECEYRQTQIPEYVVLSGPPDIPPEFEQHLRRG